MKLCLEFELSVGLVNKETSYLFDFLNILDLLKISYSYRDPTRRIGSGRIMTRDRDQRDWDRDREYGYSSGRNERRDRFDQDDNEKDMRRYSNRFNRNDRRSRGRYSILS